MLNRIRLKIISVTSNYIMHNLWTTGRILSRAIWNGISNISTATDPNLQRRQDSFLISGVSGFAKEKRITKRLIQGKFGDDAWFTAKCRTADVLGKLTSAPR